MGVTVLSSQESSTCSGTSDWRKSTLRRGSSPQARKSRAALRVQARRSPGSNTEVIEW